MESRTSSHADLMVVAEMFQRFTRQWFVSGGWAIDLAFGREMRSHSDLEIGVFRADQSELRSLLLPDWDLEKVVKTRDGPAWVPWYEGERLELPIHQVKAVNPAHTPAEFELFLNESDDGLWWFRRAREITRPRDQLAGRTTDGFPYLLPEVQLLYKARLLREKDRVDFSNVLGLLDEDACGWLISALTRFLPGHEWIDLLERRRNGRG